MIQERSIVNCPSRLCSGAERVLAALEIRTSSGVPTRKGAD